MNIQGYTYLCLGSLQLIFGFGALIIAMVAMIKVVKESNNEHSK